MEGRHLSSLCAQQEIAAQICSDPLVAGERMVPSIAAGLDEALIWVHALIYGDCPAEDAPAAAYQASPHLLCCTSRSLHWWAPCNPP